jgi:NPCBM-associated, NEW3 domain of alpha-galactosidase
MRRRILVLTSAVILAAAGAGLARAATGTTDPGCKGPQLTGTASPDLILSTPQTVSVTETLTNNCAMLRPTHIVLYLSGPQGWTISPAGARPVADLQPGSSATLSWQVTVPSGGTGNDLTAQAIYDVGSHSTDSTRATINASVVYPSVAVAFDDTGITNDGDTSPGNIDGSGYSLSAQALTAAGVSPGTAVTAGGLSFTWPSAAPGSPDNIVAAGQAITVTGSGSGSTLGFLVTGTYGPATGTGTVLYTDGTSQSFTLTAPDWYSGPASGSGVAFSMAYRNTPGNGQDQHTVQVYESSVSLSAGKTVQAVVLPDVSAAPPSAGQPALHVFAITIGG